MRALLLLLFLAMVACNTDTPTTEQPTNTPETTNSETSNLIQLDKATFSFPLSEIHQTKFLDYIQPKQNSFNTNNQGMGTRSDTLYHIAYLPFKDQELYLYRTLLDHSKGSSLLWNVAILKNGSVQVDEALVSYEEEPVMKFIAMNVGDKKLLFEGIQQNGTVTALELPYDGQKVLETED